MNIEVSVIPPSGYHGSPIVWPDGWPVPPKGGEIAIPGQLGEAAYLYVIDVTYFPRGSAHSDNEPFVHIILGPKNMVEG